ncbi:MAG: DUF99 family protein [Candidatus Aenigmarchaeota archaeon]|nr:DUF99 family protein [Candidatus Aenigmarchaeota archaeon]
MIKPEIRILGFDDGAFVPKSKEKVPVIGVICRGGKFLDGALKTEVIVDGLDATEKITKLINSTRHKQQLKVIMFDGITLAGFNIVDIKKLYEETKLPVIIINRKMPDLKKVKNALKNFGDFRKRWKMIVNAGKIKECEVRENKKVYYQSVGLSEEETEEIIKLSTTRSFIPEPLRLAHLIATAIVKGESYGRA